jgi:hypothetical protein
MPPLPVNRCTAAVSSQSLVTSRTLRATRFQSGSIQARPASAGARRASATRSADRIIALDGTHPQ